MKKGWRKLSRKQFYALGGFSNPDHVRKMVSGAWTYWNIRYSF